MPHFCCVITSFCVVNVLFLHFLGPVIAVHHLKKDKGGILEYEDEEMGQRQVLSGTAKDYNLEEFFWTGSGDGPPPPAPRGGWKPPPQATTTLLATVFVDTPGIVRPPSSGEDGDCVSECPISPWDGEDGLSISPTRAGHSGGAAPPDQRYWLLTVLQAPAAPLPPNLDARLAKLYKKAFLRQQEEHLGIKTTQASALRKKNSNGLRHSNIKTNKSADRSDGHEDTYHLSTPSYFDTSSTVRDTEELDYTEEDTTQSPLPFELSSHLPFELSSLVPFEFVTNNVSNVTRASIARVKRLDASQARRVDNVTATSIQGNQSDVMKRQVLPEDEQPKVEVFVHNISREGSGSKDLKVVYWVSVSGIPVPALTAARDMRLLADSEVVAELGYPVTTKAEPYLKLPESLNGVSRANSGVMQDTWLIVGITILAAVLLLAIVALLACRVHHGRRKASGVMLGVRPSIDSKGVQYPSEGKDNMAYIHGDKDGTLISVVSPSKQKGPQTLEERYASPSRRYVRGPHYRMNRVSSAESSASTSSGSDLSQMNANLRQRQKLFEQQMRNEYAIVNKKNKSKHRKIRSKKVGIAAYTPRAGSPTEINGDGTLQRFLVSDPPSPAPSSSGGSCESVIVRKPIGPVSPTSYLSMPSVKSFPRGNVVEPLSKVLEPLSVRHLDMDSPVHQVGPIIYTPKKGRTTPEDKTRNDPRETGGCNTPKYSPYLIRLGSMDKDPGIIGPMVWDLHRQRLQDGKSNLSIDQPDTADGGANISRMRQRFNELVDDAFSLFGSGPNTPKSNLSTAERGPGDTTASAKTLDKLSPHIVKCKSARDSGPVGVHTSDMRLERPLTALPPRPPLPRQASAWGTTSALPTTSRSTSAGGIRRPMVDTATVNSDGVLSATDPALPLLQAIRSELSKLPGTSDA